MREFAEKKQFTRKIRLKYQNMNLNCKTSRIKILYAKCKLNTVMKNNKVKEHPQSAFKLITN